MIIPSLVRLCGSTLPRKKPLDGNPYDHLRSIYDSKRGRRLAALEQGLLRTASSDLGPDITGDSVEHHEENEAIPGPLPSVDFSPLTPGMQCTYCGQEPAVVTVNQSNIGANCAENLWGIPMDGHDEPDDEDEDDPDNTGAHDEEPEDSYQDDPTKETELGTEHEAGLMDWLIGKTVPHLDQTKPHFQTTGVRFRSMNRCWKSNQLDPVGTREMGYAVWVPRDIGPCGRITVAAQFVWHGSSWPWERSWAWLRGPSGPY